MMTSNLIKDYSYRVTPPQNENFVINHSPPCRSKPVKALFVFGTQRYILDENREACDCPIDCQTIKTVKAQKSIKNIVRIVHLWFNCNVMKLREYFLYAKKEDFIQQFVCVCVQWIFSKMELRWHRGDELLNKVSFFSLRTKKYSRSFITLRLNHWWQMDYSDEVFYTFLGLDSVNCLAVNGTVTSCVPTTNEAFTGLERHGGKWLMTKFSFWGGVTL